MPTHFLSEASQEKVLNEFNQSKKGYEKIPLVARNAHSGWPLFQISLFSPLSTDSQKYEHALGGGKCHYFHIGAFNLACLLAKIPGRMDIVAGYGTQLERKHLKADNVGMFLEGFRIAHKPLGIKINSVSGAYGKELSVESTSETNFAKLQNALWETFSFGLKPKSQLSDFAGWKDTSVFTAEQIKAEINKEVAVFSGGQIFIDLGEFLDKRVSDPEIKDYFKTIFKVDEFRALQEQNDELKFKDTPEIIVPIAVTQEIQVNDNSTLRFPNLRFKIKIMEDYAETLAPLDPIKSKAVKDLATGLKNKLNEFDQSLSKEQPTPEKVGQFQSDFTKLLHSQDKLMKEHREIWKPIVNNIAFSVATLGIGLIFIGIRASINAIDAYNNNKMLAASDLLLFARTHREKLVDDLNKDVDSPATYISPNQI